MPTVGSLIGLTVLAVAVVAVFMVVHVQHRRRMHALRELDRRVADLQERADVVRIVEQRLPKVEPRRSAVDRARDRGWTGPVAYAAAAGIAAKDAVREHPGAAVAVVAAVATGIVGWLLAPSPGGDEAGPRPTVTVTSPAAPTPSATRSTSTPATSSARSSARAASAGMSDGMRSAASSGRPPVHVSPTRPPTPTPSPTGSSSTAQPPSSSPPSTTGPPARTHRGCVLRVDVARLLGLDVCVR